MYGGVKPPADRDGGVTPGAAAGRYGSSNSNRDPGPRVGGAGSGGAPAPVPSSRNGSASNAAAANAAAANAAAAKKAAAEKKAEEEAAAEAAAARAAAAYRSIMLETIVPHNIGTTQYIFYGLSGSPSTIAHGYIIKLLSKIFTDSIIVVVPVSRGYSKPPVKCVKGYLDSRGLDLRVATQLQMVTDIITEGRKDKEEGEEGEYDNVCVSLHEVRSPTGVGTYDSLKALREILARLRGGLTNEALSLVVGADQTRSIAYRTWSKVLELLKDLFEGKFKLLSFARADIPFNAEIIKGWLNTPLKVEETRGTTRFFQGIPIYGDEIVDDRTMTKLAGMIKGNAASAKEIELVSTTIAANIENLSEQIAAKIAAMGEGIDKENLKVASGELASADQVSSSKARKYWRRVANIINGNILSGKLAQERAGELLTHIIMAASDDEFPISRSIRTILLTYTGNDGVPYMSEDCEETKPIDPVGAAAVEAERAAVAAVQGALDAYLTANPKAPAAPPAGGRRRRQQRKTQRKSRRRARNARRSRKQ